MPLARHSAGRLLLVAAILAFAHARVIAAAQSSSSWFARSWESDEGLPDNNVIGIAQTSDRYLWVATLGGLVRFDGVRFQEFSPAPIAGVPNRVVHAMHLDHLGRLWLGMGRGAVVCLDARGARAIGVNDGLPDRTIAQLLVDQEETLWLAYESGELLFVRDRIPTHLGIKDGFSAEGRASMTVATNGVLWIAKKGEICQWQKGARKPGPNLAHDTICLATAHNGGVWACIGNDLLRFDDNFTEMERRALPKPLRNADVAVMLEDQNHSVWIGTRGRGLFRCDADKCEPIETSHRQILALTEDHEGNIWAGTGGGGLNRLKPRDVELLGIESGLPFEAIQSVSEDSHGRLWAVAQHGALTRKDGNKWTTVGAEAGWTGEPAMCVTAGEESAIWIGLRSGGLCKLQNGVVSRWRKQDGLAANSVRSLLAASNGDLWIGTDNPSEVQRLRNGKLKTIPTPQPARSIRAMAEDQRGTIWIGTSEGQLLKTEGDELMNVPAATPGRLLSIRALCPGTDGALWIGYAGSGLGRLKDNHYTRITAANGLAENYISQIILDGHGWLWLSGNRTLSRVAEADLCEIATGRANRIRSFIYGRGEGLSSVQASFDAFPGALRSRCGDLWIPLRKGLAVIHPKPFHAVGEIAQPIIERVSIDDTPAALRINLRPAAVPISLRPNHRKISFEFTAPSFSSPENLHFQYRLKNFDTDWTEANPERKVSYSRLPVGDYEFQVRAGVNGAGDDSSQTFLALTVPPLYWQTWWFRTSCFLAFALLLGAAVRYLSIRRMTARMASLQREAALERERARIARDIHDDLGANLTQIALLSELARQDASASPKATERVEKISTTAREVIKSLDEIVWAVNPGNDSLPHLIDYSAQFTLDYLRVAGIRCRLDLPENPPQASLSTDVRHNLFLVIKEAINNVVKHSGATEVWLRIHIEQEQLQIAIEDNGRGFSRNGSNSGGNGLTNMQKRAAEIGGVYRLASERDHGTSIHITIPLPHQFRDQRPGA